MLFIYHVDTGTMLSVDMNLALADGNTLKEAIQKITGIPTDKQVLLASGGESLDDKARVCSYSAGTDTNPIYLYSKVAIESSHPPNATVDHVTSPDFNEEIETSLNLPPVIGTVNLRSQLAQQIYENAMVLHTVCEKLVHDQHLQQQGWAAVIANLDDVIKDFTKRSNTFELHYKQYLESRQSYFPLLESVSQIISILDQIPILPALKEVIESENSDELIETPMIATCTNVAEDKAKSSTDSLSQGKTLLQWISEKDYQYSVDEIADHCRKGLEKLNETVLEDMRKEIASAIEAANKDQIREIKGLEDRLFGLDTLKTEAARYVNEQCELSKEFRSKGFLNEQYQLIGLCGPGHHRREDRSCRGEPVSGRPTTNHRNWGPARHSPVKAFVQNQVRANDIGDTSILPDLCASHKNQLKVMHKNHLHIRDIKRRCFKAKQELVVNLHHRLKWVVFVESKINELEVKLMMYTEALKRIRQELSILQQLHHAPTIYMTAVAEVVRRRAFSEAFIKWANDLACQMCAIHSEEVARRENFNSQFDGHFLSELFTGFEDMPPPFATQPPQLFDDNLPKLSIEDIENLKSRLPELALSLSLPDSSSVTQFFLSKSSVLKPETILPPASIDDRIVGTVTTIGLNSNLDSAFLPPTGSSQSVATITQPISSDRGFESETDTEEYEKVSQSPCDIMGKNQAQGSINKGEELFSKAGKSISIVGNTMSELKTDVDDFARWILCKKTELESLIFNLQEAWQAQSLKLVEELSEKDNSIQELLENKNRIEGELRKLTEESTKLRAELESKSREEANKAAERMSKSKASQSIPPRQAIRSISESQLGSVETVILSDSVKKLLSEKKSFENIRGQLIDSSRSDISTDSGVVDKSLVLKSDFSRTSVSGSSAKSVHNVSPSSSIVSIENSGTSLRDATTSPETTPRKSRVSKEKLSESTTTLIQQGKISVGSCSEGDIVLVIWDENFGTYTILQESSSYAYFLHLDSLCALGLRDEQRSHKGKIVYAHPRKQYVIGEVVNKEFCQAKKAENRYNVPVGSRFYRVKVRPLSMKPHVPSTVSTGVQSS